MPPAYVNVGAWIGAGTMVDSHALVGSCAQVGERVHLSAAAQLGGVLEPAGARPVVVEDECFIGALCGLFEGVVVRSRAVLAAGAVITASTTCTISSRAASCAARCPRAPWSCPDRAPRAGHFARERGHFALRSLHREIPRRRHRRRHRPRGGPALSAALACSPCPETEALALAERLGTPCFAYRLDIARSRYDELRAVLPPRVVLAYAVKANPRPGSSPPSPRRGPPSTAPRSASSSSSRGAAAPGSSVLFAGPGKSREELRTALAMGARIQADGIEDIERLDAILAAEGESGSPSASPLPVNLRVHPFAAIAEESRIIGGSGPSAFGVDEEELGAFLEEALRFPRVRIAGLQVFAASNERESRRLLENHRAAFAIGERLQRETGRALDCIDLGGGLGIAYAEGESGLDMAAFGSGLAALIEANPWFSGRSYRARPVARGALRRLPRPRRPHQDEQGGALRRSSREASNHLLRPLLTGQAFPVAAPGATARAGEGGVAIGEPRADDPGGASLHLARPPRRRDASPR